MKWIRQKPNWRIHDLIWLASISFIFLSQMLMGHSYKFYQSTVDRWIWGGIIDGQTDRLSAAMVQTGAGARRIGITKEDGSFVVWPNMNGGFVAANSDPTYVDRIYHAGTYHSGFWAPTRWHKIELLLAFNEDTGRFRDWSINPPTPRELAVQAAVVADRGLNPQLATSESIEQTGVYWLGYFLNIFWLLSIAGILWWCWWVPTRVRAWRAEKRKAKDLCPICMYDVCATPNKCPECGWGHEDEAEEASA